MTSILVPLAPHFARQVGSLAGGLRACARFAVLVVLAIGAPLWRMARAPARGLMRLPDGVQTELARRRVALLDAPPERHASNVLPFKKGKPDA